MTQVKHGDTVKVHYTGKLDDGTVFGTSVGHESIEFTIGLNQVIPGFEKAVIGMNQGETKTSLLKAEEAYLVPAGQPEASGLFLDCCEDKQPSL